MCLSICGGATLLAERDAALAELDGGLRQRDQKEQVLTLFVTTSHFKSTQLTCHARRLQWRACCLLTGRSEWWNPSVKERNLHY
jgi:hypothetical protein